jgi:hypothetical protein
MVLVLVLIKENKNSIAGLIYLERFEVSRH